MRRTPLKDDHKSNEKKPFTRPILEKVEDNDILNTYAFAPVISDPQNMATEPAIEGSY